MDELGPDGKPTMGVVIAIDEEGCSFDYYPGSHKPLEKRKIHRQTIKLSKGQVFVFHGWLLHAGIPIFKQHYF